MGRFLSLALFAVSAATFALSFFVPFYIDEIIYPITSARAGFDGWHTIGAWPLCKHNFDSKIPVTLWPGKFLSWVTDMPFYTPGAIRSYGMGVFVAWIGLLVWLTPKCFDIGITRGKLLQWVLAASFLGVLPFLSVLTRPEIPMAMVIVLYAFLPFYAQKHELTQLQRILLSVMILVFSSWFFSCHPKSMLFAPLAFYATWSLKPKSSWGWGFIAVLLAIVVQSYYFHALRTYCPEDHAFDAFFKKTTLQPQLFSAQAGVFIEMFTRGVGAVTVYIDHMMFSQDYASVWLPRGKISWAHVAVNGLMRGGIALVGVLWFYSLVRIVMVSARERALLKPDVAVPMLILAAVIVLAGFQQAKNFYDGLFFWLVGMVLTMVFLARSPLIRREHAYFVVALQVLSLMSQSLLLTSYVRLQDVNQAAQTNGFMPGQVKSASMLNYAERYARILQAAAKCGIHPEDENRYLMVDMFTYLSFKQSYRPANVSHINEYIMAFGRVYHSSGLIALCSALPPVLVRQSVEDNGLCCLRHF